MLKLVNINHCRIWSIIQLKGVALTREAKYIPTSKLVFIKPIMGVTRPPALRIPYFYFSGQTRDLRIVFSLQASKLCGKLFCFSNLTGFLADWVYKLQNSCVCLCVRPHHSAPQVEGAVPSRCSATYRQILHHTAKSL